MKKVLVTGASGQLGLTLSDLSLNHGTINFVFKSSKELDITNDDHLSFINEHDFDICINCAAFTNVEFAEKQPDEAYKVNSEGVRNLAIICNDSNIDLVHISTDYVFDGKKDTPYLPEDKPNPINQYGKSKLKGEQYIQKFCKKYYIVRTSWLYSKTHGNNFYKTILKKAKAGEKIRVTDQQTGCPTTTESLAKYIIENMILSKLPYGIYHYTNGVSMTWFDFAKHILKENNLLKDTLLVADNNYRTFAKRPKNSVLDTFR